MSNSDPSPCPLCRATDISPFHNDKRREYWRCEQCRLVFVASQYHLSEALEKSEYDKHQNSPSDPGYRRFLSRCLEPLISNLSPGMQGLDFGCGPGPAIADMAAEYGLTVKNFDPYYFNQQALLDEQYDFVTMTEVIEHVAQPIALLQQLNKLLKPGAILAIMTKRVISQAAFSQWHYKNDPTHICFYSLETFRWIENKMDWKMSIIDNDVVFFEKRQ